MEVISGRKLMDSSGNDLKGGVNSGGKSSLDVSLVEVSEGEGSQEGGSSHRCMHSTTKKVVPNQERRL